MESLGTSVSLSVKWVGVGGKLKVGYLGPQAVGTLGDKAVGC